MSSMPMSMPIYRRQWSLPEAPVNLGQAIFRYLMRSSWLNPLPAPATLFYLVECFKPSNIFCVL